ncbi:ferritin [bacterium]|nr:ferritin [bacterium]MBU1071715.1 ferritin [bacterium]MBU1676634.1 ferritin [bacterium]
MLKEKIQIALNVQIQAEFFSSYLYLSMSAWCENNHYEGFAQWMRMQAQEELFHALKIYDYVNMTGGRVRLQAVQQPETEWQDPVTVFEAALGHERHMTENINNLVGLCVKESDFATHAMLQWFVSEQVEEEATIDSILGKLKMMGGQGPGLFMLDQDLGQRPAPTPPAAV